MIDGNLNLFFSVFWLHAISQILLDKTLIFFFFFLEVRDLFPTELAYKIFDELNHRSRSVHLYTLHNFVFGMIPEQFLIGLEK